MGKTYEVKVKAPPREGHAGFWSAQRFFPAAQVTTVELDARQLKEMLEDDKNGFLMVENAEQLREQLKDDPDANQGGIIQAQLTPEEASALDAFRRNRAAGVPTGGAPAPAPQPEKQTAAAGGSQVQDRGPDKQPSKGK